MLDRLEAVLTAVNDCLGMEFHGPLLNERYLHHFISYRLQEQIGGLDLTQASERLVIHPEWPTFKAGGNLAYGRYRASGDKYDPVDDGTAGFIDFALGDYSSPAIGLEITLKSGWTHEEIVYDFVKLLDGRNPFESVISLNVLLRPKGVAVAGRQDRLRRRMLEAYEEAVTRLGSWACDRSRRQFLLVLELGPEARRFWYFEPDKQGFVDTDRSSVLPYLRRSEDKT